MLGGEAEGRGGASPPDLPPQALLAQFCVYFVQVNFADEHFVAGIVEVVFEQLEILFVDFPHQMFGQIVEVILNRMQPLWAVPFAFVKARDCSKVDFARGLDFVQDLLHAFVEFLGPDDFVISPAIHDEGRDAS